MNVNKFVESKIRGTKLTLSLCALTERPIEVSQMISRVHNVTSDSASTFSLNCKIKAKNKINVHGDFIGKLHNASEKYIL